LSEIAVRLVAALSDRYRIERELGQGGMATVYLAHDIKHDRRVALKVLKPELAAVLGADRFVQEIKTTAALQHPHILPLFDSGVADSFLYYVMPFIDGETLRSKLDRETQLGIDESVRIATNIADALDYAHRHGVIHRDIKPENILLHEGRPMVADFGIALAVSAAAGGRMTETGLSLGTPHYMSPEQATAEKEISARSDIYSLASVLYEMLSGQPPHLGGSAQQIIMKIVTEEAAPVTKLRKSVPNNVAAAVAIALEKLPADRFESAARFADALKNPAYATAASAAAVTGHVKRRPAAQFITWLPWVLTAFLALTALWLPRGRGGGASGSTRFAADLDSIDGFGSTSTVMVTPDGRSLVISAKIGEQPVLLLRTLDRMQSTVIRGSEGALRAFLSADGRWVAFSARGKLVKLPIEGGTPVALADSVGWAAGTWSKDGSIIYTPTYQTGLWQVSAAGGDAHLLTRPDSTAGELAHWWPQWLPDGRHVLFTAYRTPVDRATIEVLDLKSGKRKVVMQNAVMARYAASGHLLFARDGSILAVPFDPDQLTVSGAPVVVVDDVAMNYSDGFAAYDVSPTGTLVVLPASVAGSRFQIVEVDRRGAANVLLANAESFANPRFAPDLRRISLDISPPRAARDIWVVDIARGSRTRVTTEAASDFAALWTPDGRDLVYMSERPLFELYRRAADGSRPPTQLLGGGHDRILGDISADGRLAVFLLSVTKGTDIWTVTLQEPTSARQYLANGFYLAHPVLSPDGRWMAYDSDESGRPEVYVQSFPDPTVARRQVSTGGGSQPLWTKGGRELLFRRGGSVVAVTVTPDGVTGAPVQLFDGPYASDADFYSPATYDVSPDGERFLMLKWPTGEVRRRVLVTTGWWPELRALVGAGAKQ
jgi:eukaryotic-like serine/threonine-protein kinase